MGQGHQRCRKIGNKFETHSSFSSALLSLEAISSGIPVSPSAVPRGDLFLRILKGGCIRIRVCYRRGITVKLERTTTPTALKLNYSLTTATTTLAG